MGAMRLVEETVEPTQRTLAVEGDGVGLDPMLASKAEGLRSLQKTWAYALLLLPLLPTTGLGQGNRHRLLLGLPHRYLGLDITRDGCARTSLLQRHGYALRRELDWRS